MGEDCALKNCLQRNSVQIIDNGEMDVKATKERHHRTKEEQRIVVVYARIFPSSNQ
jgi:ADP-glucose pyrophosphorylase